MRRVDHNVAVFTVAGRALANAALDAAPRADPVLAGGHTGWRFDPLMGEVIRLV